MRNHRQIQTIPSVLCAPELHDFSDWTPRTVRVSRTITAGLAFAVLIVVGHLVAGTPASEPASPPAQRIAQAGG